MRSDKGALETGSIPAAISAFQARYAIRHEWQGAIACKEPRRGVWGGPPPGTPASSGPIAAQKLAYAPRGKSTLASFVPAGIPELAVFGGAASPVVDGGADAGLDAGDPDAGLSPTAPVQRPPGRCGCRVAGASTPGASSIGVGLAAAMLALALRRRTARVPGKA